jgi:hypothetical protein
MARQSQTDDLAEIKVLEERLATLVERLREANKIAAEARVRLIRSRGRFYYVARRVGGRKTYTRKPPSAIPTQASRRINSGPVLAIQFRVACARVTPNHGVISPAMITTRPSTRSVRGARDAGAAKRKTSPMAILTTAIA